MKLLLFGSLLLITLVQWANGLECYVCTYIDGASGEDIVDDFDGDIEDKSCRNGKTPKSEFLKSCEDDDDYEAACIKLYAVGELTSESGKVTKYKATARGCARATEKLPELCVHDQTYLELRLNPDIPDEIKEGIPRMNGDPKISVCSCNSYKCNSSPVLRVSHGLSIISFSVLAHKIFGLF